MVKLILCTDMSSHFPMMFALDERLSEADFNPIEKDKDKDAVC